MGIFDFLKKDKKDKKNTETNIVRENVSNASLSSERGNVSQMEKMEPINTDGVGSFTDLKELILSGEKNISFDRDYVLLDSDNFVNLDIGIFINNSDGMVIDGNGHSIDARGKVRIFFNTSENVTFKNINFKNAYYKKVGGAFTNTASCVIDSCTFENNYSGIGGAILNHGDNCEASILIKNSKFISNNAEEQGGAIDNQANNKIVIENTEFISNKAINGGGIMNLGFLEIKNCSFDKNEAGTGAGLHNDALGDVRVYATSFTNNESHIGGGILTMGEFRMSDCILDSNNSKHHGAAIECQKGSLEVYTTKITNNVAGSNAAVNYMGEVDKLNFHNCEFKNNIPEDINKSFIL